MDCHQRLSTHATKKHNLQKNQKCDTGATQIGVKKNTQPNNVYPTKRKSVDRVDRDIGHPITINEEDDNKVQIRRIIHDCEFSRNESSTFFHKDFHAKKGIASLISRSFFDNHKLPEELSVEDVEVCLKLALLVKTLSIAQSDMLGDFLRLLFEQLDKVETQARNIRHLSQKSTSILQIPLRMPPIPKDAIQIRSTIRAGRNAFLTLLPHPKIFKTDDSHVYVLPSDCMKHLLAQGCIPMDFKQETLLYPIKFASQTARGLDIARELNSVQNGRKEGVHHFNMSFMEWKDDCESAKSNKQSKYHIWLFTITVFLKYRGKDTAISTFPVAIGPKASNHDVVEEIIGLDYKKMKSTATLAMMGWSNESAPYQCTFCADLFLSLGDQPERRNANVLMLGISRTHPRWRYACNYGKLKTILPACENCFQLMTVCDSEDHRCNPSLDSRAWKKRTCADCTNWHLHVQDEKLQFTRSKGFPNNYLLGGEVGEGLLRPIVLTYEILEKVMAVTFDMVSTGRWSKEQGNTYMNDNCLNGEYGVYLVVCGVCP